MAAWLFLQAGTGKRPVVWAREIRTRFGWDPKTCGKVMGELDGRACSEPPWTATTAAPTAVLATSSRFGKSQETKSQEGKIQETY
jgi:hypothetical protein